MAEGSAVQGKLSYLTIPKIPPIVYIGVGLLLFWFTPVPEGLNASTWHLFAIFAATIVGIITNALPMGAICILSLGLCTITQTLTIKQALSGFSSHIIWLILIAFLLARGFIKTGLGARIAYYFVLHMGKSTLGLAYGIITTELALAPFTPSNTARGAGIVFPIVHALSTEYGSSPTDGTAKKMGAYLMKLAYQANVITSAMFLTATAGNPLVAALAGKMGYEFSWMQWTTAAIVPGLVSLALLPLLLHRLYPPAIKATPEAPVFARRKLDEMGPLKRNEWIMLGTFGLLLSLWVFGSELNVEPTVAALVGLGILLVSNVLNWDDIMKEHNAWHTFIWLTTLLMMSNFLTEFGMMSWISNHMQGAIENLSWVWALTLVALLYFYTHYAFASMTAHISALFSPFALVAISAGAPPMLTLLVMSFFSSLCAGITHYGTGTGPVYFGAQYVGIKDWWRVGGILSVANIIIWMTVGLLWWYMLGLWTL